MTQQADRAGDTPPLRLAGPRPAQARIVATPAPEGRAGGATDPLIVLAGRALLVDAVLLTTSIGAYTTFMVRAGYLYDRVATPLTAAALVVAWLTLIMANGGYEARRLGLGSEEFKRVVIASYVLLAAISIVSYMLPVISPPLRLVVPSLVMGTLLILLGRWILRVWLGRQREAGRFQQATLIVGDRMRAAALARAFEDDPVAGFRVIGTVQPPHGAAAGQPGAIDGWLDEVTDWIAAHNVHAVAVAESTAVAPDLLRRLAWRLEGPRVDLLVSPVLSDVAGPRVSVRPAAGLPLLHLDEPSLTGPKRALKRLVDLAIAIPLLVVLSPVLAAIAIAIKLDSLGHVLYVSDRIGRSGEIFRCVKFRTMHVGADALRADVIGDPDEDIAARYREDPRVTGVGRFLRRWSLDELPQLLNIVGGSMSLVGPRPMLPEELTLLGVAENRRHLTKPGLTGLWQISGRKEVSWDDRMRLDLHYIENWSIALDTVIMAKTAKAVVSGRGAY